MICECLTCKKIFYSKEDVKRHQKERLMTKKDGKIVVMWHEGYVCYNDEKRYYQERNINKNRYVRHPIAPRWKPMIEEVR